jgi:hypothetical protein
MGRSRLPGSQGTDDVCQCTVIPARTPGSLGIGDHGDPASWSWLGDTPGPLGIDDCAAPSFSALLETTMLAQRILPAGGTTEPAADTDADLLKAQENPELVLLAAVAYGEASTKDVFEEMAAIANVIVRQRDARKTTMTKLLGTKSTYAFAASDGNARTKALRDADPADRLKTAGMVGALKAARNALDAKGTDYSNGAYFWDGADIKSNYANHPKVKRGIKFTKPEHNIYKIKETSVSITTHWQVPGKDGKLIDGKERGKYTYVYESTAAYGGTIFWKYGADFLKATGNKEYQ